MSAFEKKNQSGAPINHARAEILRHLEIEKKKAAISAFFCVQFKSADDFLSRIAGNGQF